ncbi:YwqJ-related putative deaminase [Streptomyces sp. NPDC001852]|uniref:YwqJ-related putative deaminase n=1 Tax=Streptomyces sp. NPDC001852 TaxID=3364619 RepID=UPI00367DA756
MPEHERTSYTGRCAETALVSDQLWQMDVVRTDGQTSTIREAPAHFESAALVSRMVREPGNPDHSKPTNPCLVCSADG